MILPGPVSRHLLDELGRYVRANPRLFALDLAPRHRMWLMTVDGQQIFDRAGYSGSKLLGNGVAYMLYPMRAARVLDTTWGGSLADVVRVRQEDEDHEAARDASTRRTRR